MFGPVERVPIDFCRLRCEKAASSHPFPGVSPHQHAALQFHLLGSLAHAIFFLQYAFDSVLGDPTDGFQALDHLLKEPRMDLRLSPYISSPIGIREFIHLMCGHLKVCRLDTGCLDMRREKRASKDIFVRLFYTLRDENIVE